MKLNIDKFKSNLYPNFEFDINKYNQGGGLSRKKDYKSKEKPYPSVNKKDFAGRDRSYPIPSKEDAVDALRLAGLHDRSNVKAKVYKKYPELKKHQEGGILKAQEGTILKSNLPITTNPGELTGYNMFRSTLPSNQANNGKFNLFQGWKNYNKPLDFKTALKSNGNTPFITRESDGYHAKSVGYNKESGNYDFLKNKNHQSLQYELNWYNSKDGESFRNQYDLDTSGDYYKYVPKKSFLEIDKSKQSFLNGGKLNKTK